jgi:hypothetical protein
MCSPVAPPATTSAQRIRLRRASLPDEVTGERNPVLPRSTGAPAKHRFADHRPEPAAPNASAAIASASASGQPPVSISGCRDSEHQPKDLPTKVVVD